jgi:tetratricopeptide (TPR) repeat protein
MKTKKSKKNAGPRQVSDPSPVDSTIRRLIPISLLVLLCLAVYFNSLSNDFVYDDFGAIVENKRISQLGGLISSLFGQSYYKYAGLEASYRPVATLSYFLLYAVAKLNPFYYHLFSLVLHMLNTLLVYRLANLILRQRFRGLIAGLLFACHPVHTEAINSIDFNDDLLTTFFFLSAFVFYIRIKTAAAASHIWAYAMSLICYLLGLLSKEMAITLPAIIMLYDLVLRGGDQGPLDFKRSLGKLKERAFLYLGFVGVSLVYLCLRFFILYNPRESLKPSAGSLMERIIYLPGHIFNYIRLTLFPANLNADYVYSYPDSWFAVGNLVGFAVVVALIGAAILVYRYSREIFFGIGWFLISLSPVFNLIEIYHPLAERYLYLPVIGFCLVVPVVIHGLATRRFENPAVCNLATLIAIVVMLGLYSYVTIARNADWQNNYVLWTKTVQRSPNSLIAHGGLGMAYLKRGQLNEAASQFEKAIELNPRDHKGHYNRGLVYHKKGDLKKALDSFNRSVALNPESMEAHYNLATLYLQQRSWERAIQHYTRVVALDPDIALAHYNLGMAYAMKGQLKPAVSAWENVLQLDPHNQMARQNIQKARKMMNKSGG